MTGIETLLYILNRFILIVGGGALLILLFKGVRFISWKLANKRYKKESTLSHHSKTVYCGRHQFKISIRTVNGRSTVSVINTEGDYPALSQDLPYDKGILLYKDLKFKAIGDGTSLIHYVNSQTYRPRRKP